MRKGFRKYQDGKHRKTYMVPVALTEEEVRLYRTRARRTDPSWNERHYLQVALMTGLDTQRESHEDMYERDEEVEE